MSEDDHRTLSPLLRGFERDLRKIIVDLEDDHPVWYKLRGHLERLSRTHLRFVWDLDRWVCGAGVRDPTNVYRGHAPKADAERPSLSHSSIQDWLAGYERKLSRWENRLRQGLPNGWSRDSPGREIFWGEFETNLDRCMGLLRKSVKDTEEECLSLVSPVLPGNFATRLKFHLMRSESAGIDDRFCDLAKDVARHEEEGTRFDDGHPFDEYQVRVYALAELVDCKALIRCFRGAWTHFMIPAGQWDARSTHWYFPLGVRLEVRTLLLMGGLECDPVKCTFASLPIELHHHIARYVAYGRGSNSAIFSF